MKILGTEIFLQTGLDRTFNKLPVGHRTSAFDPQRTLASPRLLPSHPLPKCASVFDAQNLGGYSATP
jgi:hypothetical protein